MKTILVLSDTHGSASAFTRVAAKNPKADALIFLGDGCKDLEKVQDALPMPVYPVTPTRPTLNIFISLSFICCPGRI